MTLKLRNRDARRLWLDAQGLASAPTGPLNVLAIVKSLGFVQLDTIRTVARAHHHILWSRNQNYREPMLNRLLARDRTVFEHFTHDASVLPMDFLPSWTRQFRRQAERIERAGWFRGLPDAGVRAAIKARIAEEGPLSTHAFDTRNERRGEMWTRPPHKLALDYMWYGGELATSHRRNFIKFYDLSENVLPAGFRDAGLDDRRQIDRLCRGALDRLCFAGLGDIQRFWDAVDLDEVRDWAAAGGLRPVMVETAKGDWINMVAPADIAERLDRAPAPTSRLRILSPFDPAVRDRNRLARIFGFDFRIEIFVPAAKRTYGYYVYPLLQGDRFVGRIEIKADRPAGRLAVIGFWPEPGIAWGARRHEKLDAELVRLGRLAGTGEIIWTCRRKSAALTSD